MWHRIIERKGFCLNGFINHYADFMVMTKSGNMVLIETKGDLSNTPQNITKHIKKIYVEGELDENRTCNYYSQVQIEGGRSINRKIKFYNLDMILAIGYRVRSNVSMQFRNWTSKVLKEYMQKGFVMNDER